MKFSTRQDVDAPIEAVFEAACDFPRFERQARRRGVKVQRADQLPSPAPGMRWNVEFQYRKKLRSLRIELVELEPPVLLRLQAASAGISADFAAEVLALSPKRTRLKVGLEITPKSLQARLLIQSLKFAKANLDRRFAERVAKYGCDVENSYDPARALRPGV